MPIATTQSDFRNHIKDYLDKVNDENQISSPRQYCALFSVQIQPYLTRLNSLQNEQRFLH